jgi:hypothetical protein
MYYICTNSSQKYAHFPKSFTDNKIRLPSSIRGPHCAKRLCLTWLDKLEGLSLLTHKFLRMQNEAFKTHQIGILGLEFIGPRRSMDGGPQHHRQQLLRLVGAQVHFS